ncbi:MAG: metallophosphoesterase [Candidatus Diapherotrites archaeon]|nr:metallophosphoesterase [Candidatus Diapherotrites archaeon]
MPHRNPPFKSEVELANGIIATKYGALIYKDYLIVSDLHLGFEKAAQVKGIYIPKDQYKTMISNFEELIKKYKPEKIVLNGDLKHEIGKPSSQEWDEVRNLIEWLKKRFDKIIMTKGNHDNYMQNIISKYKIEWHEHFFEIDNIIIAHGHEDIVPLHAKGKIIIIGHEHPAIILRDKVGAKVKLPCYLYEEKKKGAIIVTPAFSPLSTGTNMLRTDPEGILSNILKSEGIENFRIFAIDPLGILEFPKIKELESLSLWFESI